MTQTRTRKDREKIKAAIEPVIIAHMAFRRISAFENNLIEALLPLMPGYMPEKTKDLLGLNNPELNAKLKAESDMRDRAEVALNITPDWDNPNSVWLDYNKKLVVKEKETGFTIEGFVKWWNSDDFRKEQGIWLNPEKINKFWKTAMSETDTTHSVKYYKPEDDSQVYT